MTSEEKTALSEAPMTSDDSGKCWVIVELTHDVEVIRCVVGGPNAKEHAARIAQEQNERFAGGRLYEVVETPFVVEPAQPPASLFRAWKPGESV